MCSIHHELCDNYNALVSSTLLVSEIKREQNNLCTCAWFSLQSDVVFYMCQCTCVWFWPSSLHIQVTGTSEQNTQTFTKHSKQHVRYILIQMQLNICRHIYNLYDFVSTTISKILYNKKPKILLYNNTSWLLLWRFSLCYLHCIIHHAECSFSVSIWIIKSVHIHVIRLATNIIVAGIVWTLKLKGLKYIKWFVGKYGTTN